MFPDELDRRPCGAMDVTCAKELLLVDQMVSKESLRKTAAQARRLLADKDRISKLATDQLLAMPQYAQARRVMWYVDVRDELRTRDALQRVLVGDQQIAVPYCVGQQIRLCRLDQMQDLAVGAFGILEPRQQLRGQIDRNVSPNELDLVVVPGVAFDRRGGRLGHGHGFYDRLLADVADRTVLVGLAFQCQVVNAVPTADHDVSMDWLVTETQVVRCG
ncbi:5-formyltetrahydrofolate cyclo-ligase [Stieleria sp. TO1_6]|uniref:5-formyltetrahydrofolate cyclo-ligase n=1 Tax=Stieleria tagensis TaxID=2956795 RepID=UPI00209A6515|nr:5-formyltetrahydrofolate cyclo-ligase [Stieleria tagensis]MCO8121180.1 5-formyltetrahydrofolate cyclo-ligase [Stieleria tagensis]